MNIGGWRKKEVTNGPAVVEVDIDVAELNDRKNIKRKRK